MRVSDKPSVKRQQGKKTAKTNFQARLCEQLQMDAFTDPWARGRLERRSDYLPIRKTMLLVCEGEKTEPYYFESLKKVFKLPIKIEIIEGEGDPLSVVESAINYKLNYNDEYDEIWAVFDRDSFDVKRITEAFRKAVENEIKIAFSNEAFEIWYVLHFKLVETPLLRDKYKKQLSQLLGKEYQKNDPDIINLLRNHMAKAVGHALHLANNRDMYSYELIEENPFTGIHFLIFSFLEGIANEVMSEELRKIKNKYPTI